MERVNCLNKQRFDFRWRNDRKQRSFFLMIENSNFHAERQCQRVVSRNLIWQIDDKAAWRPWLVGIFHRFLWNRDSNVDVYEEGRRYRDSWGWISMYRSYPTLFSSSPRGNPIVKLFIERRGIIGIAVCTHVAFAFVFSRIIVHFVIWRGWATIGNRDGGNLGEGRSWMNREGRSIGTLMGRGS